MVRRSSALLSTSVPWVVASSRLVVHAIMRLNPAAGWVRTVKKLKTAKTPPYSPGLKWWLTTACRSNPRMPATHVPPAAIALCVMNWRRSRLAALWAIT